MNLAQKSNQAAYCLVPHLVILTTSKEYDFIHDHI